MEYTQFVVNPHEQVLPPEQWRLLRRFCFSQDCGRISMSAQVIYLRDYRTDISFDWLDQLIFDAIKTKYPNVLSSCDSICFQSQIELYKRALQGYEGYDCKLSILPQLEGDLSKYAGIEIHGFEIPLRLYTNKRSEDFVKEHFKYEGFFSNYQYSPQEEKDFWQKLRDPQLHFNTIEQLINLLTK